MRLEKICFLLLTAAFILLISGSQLLAADLSASGWKVINLDIDRSVYAQKRLQALVDERVDLHAFEDSIRLWTNPKGLRTIRDSIRELRKKYPSCNLLTFVGSGDFHQTAALLIESLPESARPVTVLMFDNHPDWFRAPAHFHCGAWVVQALKNPFVERVILVGQNSSDIRGDQFLFSPFKELCKGRLELYPYSRSSAFVPFVWVSEVAGVEAASRSIFGTELKFKTLTGSGVNTLAAELGQRLSGKNIYISIDKDVLNLNDAVTDWDQGQLSLNELLSIINRVLDSANLVGMDICGERAPEPVRGILKSIDCGREFKRRIKNFDKANVLNERSNLLLIKTLRESAAAGQVSGRIKNEGK